MTTNYNRSQIYSFDELSENQQLQTMTDNCLELSDCHSTSFVKFSPTNFTNKANNVPTFLPLSMFMRTNNNKFTHGIYGTSAFDGYFITFDRQNEYCVIAHKYF